MDRSEIVRTFLAAGYQIGADALTYFEENPDRIQAFLSMSSGKIEQPIITKNTIDKILGGVSQNIKIVRTFSRKEKQITVGQIATNLASRYRKIMELMLERTELVNLISVNRISQQTKRFSLIVMIKEINYGDRSLVVEDPTGQTSVYISDEVSGDFNYLVEDEVVGLVCDNEDSSENRAVRIFFPDIPLPTKIATSQKEEICIFLSDIHIGEPSFMPHSLEKLSNYLKKIKEPTTAFVLGDVSPDEEQIKKFTAMFPENFTLVFLKGEQDPEAEGKYLPDPVIVELSGVKIFLSHGKMFAKYFERFKTSPENMLVQLLKKRHLSPTFERNGKFDEENLFLDEVPDIFVIGHFQEPRTMNYKGATIISLGSFLSKPVFWGVNLKTRESIKIDLT